MKKDLISRQAAIDATYDVLASYSYIDEPGSDVAERVEDILKEMPSVQFEQKLGQWILNKHTDTVLCSQCGKCYGDEYNYCPNCGAKMEE